MPASDAPHAPLSYSKWDRFEDSDEDTGAAGDEANGRVNPLLSANKAQQQHEADAAELSALKVLLAPSPRLTLTSRFRCRPRSLFVLLSDTHSLRSGRNGSVASDGEHTCSAHGCQAPAMVIVVAAVRIDMHLDIIMCVNGCVCDILYVRRHRYAN